MHMRTHIGDGPISTVFEKPFPCIACRFERHEEQNIIIDGYEDWNRHVLSTHYERIQTWTAENPSGIKKKHECFLCGRNCSSCETLARHCEKCHVDIGHFEQPFECPKCRVDELPAVSMVGVSSWSLHTATVHGIDHSPVLNTGLPSAETQLQCPFCGLCIHRPLFKRHFNSHVRAGISSTVFSTPFTCRSCKTDDQAIEYAVKTWNVDIITISSGSQKPITVIDKAIKYVFSQDVIMFAATSNNGANADVAFPASTHEIVIGINSADTWGNKSNFTPTILPRSENFSVLGEAVESSWPHHLKQGSKQCRSGTSYATPIAAGIAANIIFYTRIRFRTK